LNNGASTIDDINASAVSLVSYTAGIINWRKDELDAMDRKTRMAIHNSLHLRADVDRQYISRKEGRRKLIGTEESVCMEDEKSKQVYRRQRVGITESYTKTENVLNNWNDETDIQLKHGMRQEQKEMDGEPAPRTIHETNSTSCRLEELGLLAPGGSLKKDTEGFMTATQDQALGTNAIQVKIDKKQQGEVKCRICKDREETVEQISSDCSKLTQLEYKKRHVKSQVLSTAVSARRMAYCVQSNGTNTGLNQS